jgi:hypothetical protein
MGVLRSVSMLGRAGWSILLGLCSCAFWMLPAPGAASAACANEGFRGGASADLPDCRAYELVTPASAPGRLLYTIESEFPFNLFPTELATPEGNSVLFMTKGMPLAEPSGANGTHDLYEAQRTSAGWQTVRRLSPSGEETVFPSQGGVSSDHGYTFIEALEGLPGEFGGTLGEEGLATYLGMPNGDFELLGTGSIGTERVVQGRFISPNAEHVIFASGDTNWCFVECPVNQLEPTAPPTGTAAIYDRSLDGPLRVVSLLPGEITPAAGENAEYQGTSSDGSLVAFKIGEALYVRVNNAETKEVTSGPFVFGGIRGGHVFYLSGGDIFSFRIATGEREQVTELGDVEVVNISDDGTHVYFLSYTAAAGTGAEPGQPNLYLWTESDGLTHFIATVSPADLEAEGRPALNTWTTQSVTPAKTTGQGPGSNSSRTTPDGRFLVFESKARLEGYENQEHDEIYRYDSNTDTLVCVSCNLSGTPATANARLEALSEFNVEYGGGSMVIHNLSVDGSRIFFETSEKLIDRDIDGVNDIYEWHTGASGPELSLISSGQSRFYANPGVPLQFQEPNVLFAVTPSGNDVVFRTTDQLLPSAPGGGSTAIYDARVNGGFAEPPLSTCETQVCEGNVSRPGLSAPKSNTFHGSGNVKRRHRQCRRARHHKKGAHRSACRHHRHKKGAGK